MKKLQEFYGDWTRYLASMIGVLAIFLVRDLVKYAGEAIFNNVIFKYIFGILISSGFFAWLYGIGEKLIRKKLWKLRWFKQELDFSGKWYGWSYYNSLELESGIVQKKDFQPFFSFHEAVIEQDCLSIAVASAIGQDYVRWGSITATVSDDEELQFAYTVNYQEEKQKKFEDKATGIEKLKSVLRLPKGDKLPILLTGYFFHCVDGRPCYKGKTTFIRQGYLKHIKPENLPGYASSRIIDDIKTKSLK